jgi:hypothetical protein
LVVVQYLKNPERRACLSCRISANVYLTTLSLEKAESYAGSKKRKPAKVKKAIPHLVKALKDPNNLDALIQAAFFGTASDAAEVLEYAESVGAFSINFILTSASKYTMVQGVLN